jgi:hypothetical protein
MGTSSHLRAESDGSAAVRAEVQPDGKIKFIIINQWNYPNMGLGDVDHPFSILPWYTNQVSMRFADSDRCPVTYQPAR